jgi:drug/metabolite transporter (DMT)-like permease
MKKDLRKAYIALGLVSFFWGTTYVAARIGAQHMPGLFLAGLRQFTSGFILVAFFLAKGYRFPSREDMKKISVQGLLLLCIANGLLTWSVEYISGGLAAIIAAMGPLFITFFSVLLSAVTRVTRMLVAGLLTGFAGVLLILYNSMDGHHSALFPIGILMAVIATLSWSYGSVYSSKQKLSVDILFNVGLQMLLAGIVMLLICFATGKTVNLSTVSHASLYALVYLVIFGSLLAYSAYVFAISKLPPTLVSIYAYINPIVAVGLGWLLLKEKLNASMIAGTIITLAGIWLVKRESKKLTTKKIT